jgi:hypothetical protein
VNQLDTPVESAAVQSGATALRRGRRRRAVTALIAAALLLGACATLPAPPTPEIRERLGQVAIVAVPSSPGTDFHTFATSRPEGVAKGSALGATEGLLQVMSQGAASGGGGPYAGAAMAIAGLIFMVLGAIGGGIAGHHHAVPADVAQQAESRVQQAIGDLDLVDALASRMSQEAASRPELQARELAVFDTRSAPPGRESLQQAGVDSTVTIRVLETGFEGGSGSDPSVRLYLSTHLSVAGTADGAVAYERDFRYSSPDHRLSQWLADGGQALQQGFEAAVSNLAERMLDELFLVAKFPFASGLWALPGSEEFGTCWFRPLYPAHRVKGFGTAFRENLRHPTDAAQYMAENMILYETVDSLQPTLRWEAFPRPRDIGPENAAVLRSIGNVSYDLKLWSAPDGHPGQLVVDESGLGSPEYHLDRPLHARAKYFWAFRARYALDGRMQASRWAYSPVPANAVGMPAGGSCDLDQIPDTNYYRFSTP